MKSSENPRRSGGRRRIPLHRALTCLIAFWLAVGGAGAGCANGRRGGVEYIPADRAVLPLKKGAPSPGDGWFVPPAVMVELVPGLEEKFRSGEREAGNEARNEGESEKQDGGMK